MSRKPTRLEHDYARTAIIETFKSLTSFKSIGLALAGMKAKFGADSATYEEALWWVMRERRKRLDKACEDQRTIMTKYAKRLKTRPRHMKRGRFAHPMTWVDREMLLTGRAHKWDTKERNLILGFVVDDVHRIRHQGGRRGY